MKKLFFFFIFLFTIGSLEAQSPELEKLVYTKQFTLLQEKLKEKKYAILPELDVYRGIVLNAFSKPVESQAAINAALKKKLSIHDSLNFYLHYAQTNNFIALGDYKNALGTGELLITKFASFFDADQMEEEKEGLKIWTQLIKTPPQQLKRNADTRLPLTKDVAGLWNIPVKINDSTSNFIFDSGAGLCTVSATYAKLLGLTVRDSGYIDVKSGITGIINKARVGLAKELQLGNIAVTNVIFIILPDSSLTFGNGAYVVKGIIGFPVIKAFEHFTITKKEIFIPQTDTSSIRQSNMAIDQLKPIIYLTYNDDVLPFTFDTGARNSVFSNNFYNRYKDYIDKTGTPKETSMGGAGGYKKFNMMEMPEIALKQFDKTIILKKARVSKEKVETTESYYYGNLGQDIIKQYDSLTIDFKYSYILLQ